MLFFVSLLRCALRPHCLPFLTTFGCRNKTWTIIYSRYSMPHSKWRSRCLTPHSVSQLAGSLSWRSTMARRSAVRASGWLTEDHPHSSRVYYRSADILLSVFTDSAAFLSAAVTLCRPKRWTAGPLLLLSREVDPQLGVDNGAGAMIDDVISRARKHVPSLLPNRSRRARGLPPHVRYRGLVVGYCLDNRRKWLLNCPYENAAVKMDVSIFVVVCRYMQYQHGNSFPTTHYLDKFTLQLHRTVKEMLGNFWACRYVP